MKALSLLLLLTTLVSLFSLTACGKPELTVGVGQSVTVSGVAEATAQDNGSADIAYTVCALFLDQEGRIVDLKLDALEFTMAYTASGEALSIARLKSKNALGEDYGMKAAGVPLEWYEQAEAFASVCIGKTLDGVTSLVTDDGKGSPEVIKAGCTIRVSEFVKAVADAYDEAKDGVAAKRGALSLTLTATQRGKDATERDEGEVEVNTSILAIYGDAPTARDEEFLKARLVFDASGKLLCDKDEIVTQ